MLFNTQATAKNLPRGITHFGNPNDYKSLPPEAKIAYFRDAMKLILLHESTHLIQNMENPDHFRHTLNDKMLIRILPAYILYSTATLALPVNLQRITFYAGLFVTIGGMVYIEKTGKVHKVEKGAYESLGDKAKSMLKNPFTFTVESDPRPVTP